MEVKIKVALKNEVSFKYRITVLMKIEMDVIACITASQIGQAVIIVCWDLQNWGVRVTQ